MSEIKDSLYNSVKQKIKTNKQIRLDGGVNCIPWKNLKGLSTIVPGIQRSKYYLVTANSKVGKTQLADYLFIYEPYEYVKKYKPKNINLKIYYFSLEMSKERKIMSILSYKIYKDKGIIVSPDDLLSVFEDKILDDKIEGYLDEYHDYFLEFEDTVTIIDNIRNPVGISKYIAAVAENRGTWSKKTINWVNEDGTKVPKEVKDKYIPNDPNEHVIVIIDNYNVMLPEQKQDLHAAISNFSSNYALHMRDKLNYTVVGVQQQAAAQEQLQFTNQGDSIIDKLKPSQDGLGDCKLVGRDVNLMIGLFAPARYKIGKYEGYDIKTLKDHYRELVILLNRDGSGFCSDHLLFHGAVNFFEELPPAEQMTATKYDQIRNNFKIK